jgi:hypothetical protein
MKYRRVLRTKEQYLNRYTGLGLIIAISYIGKLTYDNRKGKNSNRLSSQLNKIRNNQTEEDPSKINLLII